MHSAYNGQSTSSRNRLCSDPLSQYDKMLNKLNDSSWSPHSMTFPQDRQECLTLLRNFVRSKLPRVIALEKNNRAGK